MGAQLWLNQLYAKNKHIVQSRSKIKTFDSIKIRELQPEEKVA